MEKRASSRRLFAHFIVVLIAAFTVITVSLHTGVYIQNAGITERIITIALVHLFIVFVALNIRTQTDLDVRINPYISIMEWGFNVRKLFPPRKDKFLSCFIEIVAQLLGATIASALFYASISTS